MGIKRAVRLGAVVMILFQAFSCSIAEEPVSPDVYSGERLQMNISLPEMAAASADGETIGTLRAIVFNDKGQIVYNKVKAAAFNGGVYSAQAEAAPGYNRFYIVCNETKELTTKLDAVAHEQEIEKITFSAAAINPPLPMYGKVARAWVSSNSDGSGTKITIDNVTTDYLPVEVNRMVAKLSFTAIKNVTLEDDFTVTGLRIKVGRMPASTTIGGNLVYTADVWAKDLELVATGTLDNNGAYAVHGDVYTVPNGVDKIIFPDIYVPEHLLETPADASRATYLKVDAACRLKDGSTQTLNSIYLLNIGQAPPQNHNLTRNNEYRIYATITGLGAMGLYAEIVALEYNDVTVNWKPIEGLVIVSDGTDSYDFTTGSSHNVNVWNDYNVYSGILKVYHSQTGYKDLLFKYGSLIAVQNDRAAGAAQPFLPPADGATLNDILWYPSSYGNPVAKIGAWSDIPYLNAGDIPVDNSRVADGIGDPCKLVGLSETQIRDQGIVDNQQWHMATPQEYAILKAAADGETSAGYNDYGYRAFHSIILPNEKYRDASGELSAGSNGGGRYWTTTGVSAFGFTNADPTAAAVAAATPEYGYTVRCVRNVIPESFMQVDKSPQISYQGNITTGAPFHVVTNVPYGTATLITAGADAGTATDFNDFSFEPGDTHVHTYSGPLGEDIRVYIKRKEITTSRTFKIKVEGMGYDGKTVSQLITASQSPYTLRGTINLVTEERVPQAGKTYTLTIDLTPKDISVPTGTLRVEAEYLNTVIATTSKVNTVPDVYSYPNMEITIPGNVTPDVIGIAFYIYFVPDGATYSRKIGESYILQDNK